MVPCQVLDRLLTALHLLSYPSSHQCKLVAKLHPFVLDFNKVVDLQPRAATVALPFVKLHVSVLAAMGISFAINVLNRSKQLILVVRVRVTAFITTIITLIDKEQH